MHQIRILTTIVACFASSWAVAQTHNYINMTRSGMISHVYFSTGAEAEFGDITVEAHDMTGSKVNSRWTGFGIQNAIGLEVLKFIRFSLAHTYSDLKRQDRAIENVSGSRLAAQTTFVFLAPIGNLEFGGGLFASQSNYQNASERTQLFGTGHLFNIGLNYFFSSDLSVFGQVKVIHENKNRSDGSQAIGSMQIDTHSVAIGFSVWK